jgi:hypothetical protein
VKMEIDSFPPVPNSKFAGSYRVHQTVVHGCKRNGSIGNEENLYNGPILNTAVAH